MVGLSMTGSCFFNKHKECKFPNECKCDCHLIIIKVKNYISRIDQIEEENLKMATKLFDWDTWEKSDVAELIKEQVDEFNWKKWLRIMVRMSSNKLSEINDDFAEDFEIVELLPFCEDEDCKKIFWDYHSEYVLTSFIPELGIIASDILFSEHSFPLHLYISIWEMSEEYR